jgi:hypothetical protein
VLYLVWKVRLAYRAVSSLWCLTDWIIRMMLLDSV